MSKTRTALIISILVILGLVLANFIIELGMDPGYNTMGTDSGTFAYCGQVIHDGGLMYRDCWDNKPPGVYYLNAAAISLSGSSPYAIWLFQAAWLSAAVIAFYLIIDSVWGHKGVAALGSFVLLFFVLYPGIFQGGNFTETYAILPIVLSMGALWAFLRAGKWYWLVALGILTACGFLLKPTYISLGLAAGMLIAYLDIRRREFKHLLSDLAILVASALLPLLLVALYWVLNGDFNDLWFAVFTHNFGYVEQGFSLTSLYGTLRLFLAQQPMLVLTILVAIAAGVYLYQNARQVFSFKKPAAEELAGFIPGEMDHQLAIRWFIGSVLLSFILDALFLASSGKNFGHYLQVLLPGMTVIFLYLIDVLRRSFRDERSDHVLQVALISAIVIVLLSAGLELAAKEKPSLQALKAFISTPVHTQYQPTELEQYVIDHSSPQDSVLVWAGHPGMNFVTHRRSPTRYIFLLHLFSPTPGGPAGFSEFMQELAADPPKLIVTQPVSSMGLPNFESSADSLCPSCSPAALEGMLAFKHYVTENYELKFSIWDWEVYQRIQ
jgi:hypothetical protein